MIVSSQVPTKSSIHMLYIFQNTMIYTRLNRMVNLKRLEREAAGNERVELRFYTVTEKHGKKILKPLAIKTSVPIAVVRAVMDKTIVGTFYQRLGSDLLERGVKSETTVQIRAAFSKSNFGVNPMFKGTVVLCEVKV